MSSIGLRVAVLVLGIVQVMIAATLQANSAAVPAAASWALVIVAAGIAVLVNLLPRAKAGDTLGFVILALTAGQAMIAAALVLPAPYPDWLKLGLVVLSAGITFALNQLPSFGNAPAAAAALAAHGVD